MSRIEGDLCTTADDEKGRARREEGRAKRDASMVVVVVGGMEHKRFNKVKKCKKKQIRRDKDVGS